MFKSGRGEGEREREREKMISLTSLISSETS